MASMQQSRFEDGYAIVAQLAKPLTRNTGMDREKAAVTVATLDMDTAAPVHLASTSISQQREASR